MSFCKGCFSGVTHEGTPKGTAPTFGIDFIAPQVSLLGKWEKIGGVDCYVGTPTIDYPKDKVILYLPDVFGPQLINAQLLIDDFAANGFKTIGIDYFEGGAVSVADLESGNVDTKAWFAKHSFERTQPCVDRVIAALQEQGTTTFYATGYCYGARLAFNLAVENVTKASAIAHPSFIEVPKDLEIYLAKSQAPLLINGCENDARFPPEAQVKADELLGGDKFKPGYRREYFPGCKHGFAVRGNTSEPLVKAGKEGAFKATVEWFLKY
ncbi:dienelactone hydrolase endo-1,3,1,4-beta-D-glucanase [Crepidotus variabilis]|uniref:Dienelactone hydrolase endo-1,3,1,4-beta-D-glucanase n=1 Tax=Crepidotus variabilis TaxID=179855 RepID=A0A9P6E6G5_9AGAR|nr:dienelactone hydrolase endo-1,3,1,4-beta-D-glucanase [Crepidotus variabilis]